MNKLFLGAMLCAGFTYGANVRAEAPLRFEDAARKTLGAHPQFRQFSLALEAAQAREAQAQLKPALELAGSLENALGTGSSSGLKGSELTVSLGSVFERGNKRGARMDLAQSSSQLIEVQNRIDALDVLSETGRRFIALAAAQEAKLAADDALKLASATLDAIKPRVRAAVAAETEALNAEIVQVEAMLQVGNATRRVQAAQQALALSWDEPDAAPVVVMDIYSMPKPADAATLIKKLDALPDITQYAARSRVAQAEVNLAKAGSVSDWRWSAGVRRLEGINDQAFVVGLSIPLGQAQRNLSFVREAEINTELPDLTAQAERLKLKALLVTTLKDMASAIAEEHVVRDHQLPQAMRVMTLTQEGYALGRYDYRDVALAQAQVQSLKLKRLGAAQSYHLARIELERLTGAQLNLLGTEQ